jgi:hypothetical protein
MVAEEANRPHQNQRKSELCSDKKAGLPRKNREMATEDILSPHSIRRASRKHASHYTAPKETVNRLAAAAALISSLGCRRTRDTL